VGIGLAGRTAAAACLAAATGTVRLDSRGCSAAGSGQVQFEAGTILYDCSSKHRSFRGPHQCRNSDTF